MARDGRSPPCEEAIIEVFLETQSIALGNKEDSQIRESPMEDRHSSTKRTRRTVNEMEQAYERRSKSISEICMTIRQTSKLVLASIATMS